MEKKGWKRKWFVFWGLVTILLPFVQSFANGYTAIALTTNDDKTEQQLFDNEYGKAAVYYQTQEDHIDWQINIHKNDNKGPTRLVYSMTDVAKKTAIVPTLVKEEQSTNLFEVKTNQNAADYGHVVEKEASITIKNDLIKFTTPVVEGVNLKIMFTDNTAENKEETVFSKEYPITVAKENETESTTEQTTSSSTTSNSTVSSSETAEETSEDVTNLGDVDEETFNSAKKEAEKKYAEIGTPQTITRSAAVTDTSISNGAQPKYKTISYDYPSNKLINNAPSGVFVNDKVADPNNQNLSDVEISKNVANYSYKDNNADKDGLCYQDHGGDVVLNGNKYAAHTYLHKSIKETDTQGLFDVTIKVKGDSYNPPKPLDIVLVFDRSYSMYSNKRIDAAKLAAKSFVESMLMANLDENNKPYATPPINISLVTFDTNANQKTILTSDKTTLENQINAIPGQNGSRGGNTNLQAGIIVGGKVLEKGRPGVDKIMVLLNDGAPSQTYIAEGIDTTKKIPILQKDNISSPVSIPGDYVRFPVQEYPGILNNFQGVHVTGDGTKTMFSLGAPAKGPGFHLYDRDSSNPFDKKDVETPFQSYKIQVGGVTDVVNDHIWPTISQAKLEQSKGTTIYTLGIELTKDESNPNGVKLRNRGGDVPTLSTPNQAINTLKNLATPSDTDAYYTSADKVAELSQKLQKVSDDINKTINKGTIVDQLSENVIYQPGTIKTEVKTKSGTTQPTPSLANESISDQLTKGPTKITLGDLTLGKDETATITYQVRINTERPDFKPDYFYLVDNPISPPTLQPLGDRLTTLPFPIQSVKAPGVKLNITKKWEGDKNDSGLRPASILFDVSRKADGSNEVEYPFAGRYFKLSGEKGQNSWSQTDITQVQDENNKNYYLPQFNNVGKDFTYSVDEQKIPGYEMTVQSKQDDNLFEFTNTLNTVNLKLQKQGDNGQVLADTHFSLSKDNKVILSDVTTDKNGVVTIKSLTPGNYQLKETKAQAGYNRDNLLINFEVTPDKKIELAENTDKRVVQSKNGLSLTITNHLKAFNLNLTKIDNVSKKPIKGAVFSLSDSKVDPKNTVMSNPTDSDGKIVFNFNEKLSALQAGKTYYLKEETAPEGYNKLTGYFEISIDSAGKVTVDYIGDASYPAIQPSVSLGAEEENNTITFSIENKPKVPLPATGGMGVWLIYGVGALALVVAGGYYFLRNKSKGEA
ncbi:hypothetical protein EsVE80_19050 [Enterococcus saigonensis]|uniref:VWFA domain-containing protein n=1 Tax=Enterococcus saigonensis TaxID=1805431 RepID=A0A679IJQ7_9ENTE|nr:SpaA isopeptide-forming pilin-related protein [Enterococcus saigonensis]BCA86382.1 hypothetical protein EsVE80_19050 [Enterococcus saigonensis]